MSFNTIAIDFDGVLHQHKAPYTVPEEVNDTPTPGALTAVHAYHKAGLEVVVITTRACAPKGKRAVEEWLALHKFPPLEVTATKLHAAAYIDDRAFLFTGRNWPTVKDIRQFRPWNKRSSRPAYLRRYPDVGIDWAEEGTTDYTVWSWSSAVAFDGRRLLAKDAANAHLFGHRYLEHVLLNLPELPEGQYTLTFQLVRTNQESSEQ